jgi:1-acyl-sn-glycerol-3-phosphate acyltransferase
MKKLTGTHVALEGIEHFPTTSAVLACNSTHKMDWFFFQEFFMNLGLRAPIISKGKNWHEPTARFGCHFLDALPMVSRGYILSVDLQDVLGERPDEALYRRIRAYVDHDEHPGDDPVTCRILTEQRDILGATFSPTHTTYREFIRELYYRFQHEHLLRMSRDMVHQNHHIHIYPQGTVSSRLSRGRIGAVELALALGIPIVPIGLSGAPDVFVNDSLPLLKGGEVTMRVGEPMYLDEVDVPDDFKPFHPDHEERYREPLQLATDEFMERLNALLDPPYQWADTRQSDGKQGIKRFI